MQQLRSLQDDFIFHGDFRITSRWVTNWNSSQSQKEKGTCKVWAGCEGCDAWCKRKERLHQKILAWILASFHLIQLYRNTKKSHWIWVLLLKSTFLAWSCSSEIPICVLRSIPLNSMGFTPTETSIGLWPKSHKLKGRLSELTNQAFTLNWMFQHEFQSLMSLLPLF